jgi:hypothetical protein
MAGSATAELQKRVGELRAKEPNLSLREANSQVMNGDPQLQERYFAEMRAGAPRVGDE